MSKVAAFLGDGLRRPSTATSPTRERKDSILRASPPLTLEPSMEGPPSPRTIRAYTENMKSGSHGRTRTNSTVSSFGSDGQRSGPPSPGPPTLRRQTSKKSISSMSIKADRPDSISMFGKSLFSRGSRKSKVAIGRARASSSLSLHPREMPFGGSTTTIDEEQSFKKHLISGPYNFKHVTHTGQDHASAGDEVKSRNTSLDEFAPCYKPLSRSLHAPMAPHPGLEVYVPEDEEADNSVIDPFNSFDTMHTIKEHAIPPPHFSPPQHHIPRKQVPPVNVARPTLRTSQSHDSVRNALGPPPPRPPRSPMTQGPGPSLPPRTSSRNGSQTWEEHDPLMSTSLERPHYASGFRRPQAFHLPLSPPAASAQPEEKDYFQQPLTSPRQQDPGWPFASPAPSATSTSDSPLADVPEEEPINFSRRQPSNRTSTSSIRASRSVPNLNLTKPQPHDDWPAMPTLPTAVRLPLASFENWEDDIDYCYEHEVEADCEYDWLGRASLETERESTHNPFHDSGVSVGDALAITAGHAISPTSPKTQRRRHPPVSMHTAKNSLGRRLELASQSEQMRSPPSESFVTPPTAVETEPELVFAPTVGDATKNTSLLAPAPLDIGISFPHSPSLLLPHDFSSAPSSDLDADADAVTSRLSIDINSFFYEQQGTVFPALDFSVLTRLSAPRDSTSTSTATHSYRSSAEVEGEVEGVLNGDGAALRSSGGSSTSLATSVDEVKDGRGVELFTSTSASGGRREHSASISSASFSSNPFSAYIEPAPARGLTPIEAFPLPPVSPPLPEPEPASASTSIAEEPLNLELALARQEAETRLLPPSPSPSACAQGEAMASRHGRKGSVPLMSAGVTRGEVMEGKEGRDGKEKDGKEKDGKDGRKGRVRSSTVGSRGKSAYGLFPSASAVNSGAPF